MVIKINNNLSLESMHEKHAPQIFKLVDEGRMYLREWLPWVDFTKEMKDTQDFIKSTFEGADPDIPLNYVILWNNEVVGVIGMHKIDDLNKITSIGYWLGEEFQGRGIMTEAVRALSEHCFNHLGLNRVEIQCATNNFKSQAIPEKLNFVKEGTTRQAEFLNGKFVDLFLYSKLKEEWQNS